MKEPGDHPKWPPQAQETHSSGVWYPTRHRIVRQVVPGKRTGETSMLPGRSLPPAAQRTQVAGASSLGRLGPRVLLQIAIVLCDVCSSATRLAPFRDLMP
jgi:hypothetical protein